MYANVTLQVMKIIEKKTLTSYLCHHFILCLHPVQSLMAFVCNRPIPFRANISKTNTRCTSEVLWRLLALQATGFLSELTVGGRRF
jgi:hypothetical protein